MPRIDQEIKLDFKDVLIRPKRSTLRSRAEVRQNREREHVFTIVNFMNEIFV